MTDPQRIGVVVPFIMLRIGDEKDIEVLRQAALILDRENEKLLEKNIDLQREIMRLRNESPEQIQQRIQALEEMLQRARQEMFGITSPCPIVTPELASVCIADHGEVRRFAAATLWSDACGAVTRS